MSLKPLAITAMTCVAFAASASVHGASAIAASAFAQDTAARTTASQDTSDLAAPVLIHAGDEPIDVQGTGHSAPFFGDFDGDGVNDLLVGQYDDGKLRIYRNVGSNAKPHFKESIWFKGGAEAGRVPTG